MLQFRTGELIKCEITEEIHDIDTCFQMRNYLTNQMRHTKSNAKCESSFLPMQKGEAGGARLAHAGMVRRRRVVSDGEGLWES